MESSTGERVQRRRRVAARSLPVTTRLVPRLFARNERVVSLFETDQGPLAVILVGAIFVASMDTVWAGSITPGPREQVRCWDYDANDRSLDRGAEMGRFNMGSTVILLFARDRVHWSQALQPGDYLRMGQRIGALNRA